MDDLLSSIPHEGLLNPPLVIQQPSDFRIVSGFRRIAAFNELGLQPDRSIPGVTKTFDLFKHGTTSFRICFNPWPAFKSICYKKNKRPLPAA